MSNKTFPDEITDDLRKEALSVIASYQQKVQNDNAAFKRSGGIVIQDEHYTNLSLKRSNVIKSTFRNCIFDQCALTGSSFIQCVFDSCVLDHSNMEIVDFTSSIMDNSDREIVNRGNNFNYANFTKANLRNIKMEACCFSHCLFDETTLDSCSFELCAFEDAIFHQATLRNITMMDLNIEYADFTDAVFDNVCIPIMQLPYTYGGLQYFFHNEGLYLATHRGKPHRLDRAEYKRLLDALVVYYIDKNEFFPLANICLLNGSEREFKEVIQQGLKYANHYNRIRDIKHLVTLIEYSGWSSSLELHDIYYSISQTVNANIDNLQFAHSAQRYVGELRNIMMKPATIQPQRQIELRFVIDTEFDNNTQVTNEAINHITNSLQGLNLTGHPTNITVNKNSPFEFIIQFPVIGDILLSSLITGLGAILYKTLPKALRKLPNVNIVMIKGDNNTINITKAYVSDGKSTLPILRNNRKIKKKKARK
ncbi:MAG: pentapeptide repeat-containing protein [Bacteroides cellulosilyticus]|nr:pentapeptide repeat-containing protein [Bacteroides cellulosilyticus]